MITRLRRQTAGPQTDRENSRRGGYGLPRQLRMRAEQAAGIPLDGVRVHYHSDKPQKLGAFAVTQGDDIYLGRGSESTLGHELVHVVQQRLGMVRPNRWTGGTPVNADPALEQAADRMRFPRAAPAAEQHSVPGGVVQRTVWRFEGGKWVPFSGLEMEGPFALPDGDFPEWSTFDDVSGKLTTPGAAERRGLCRSVMQRRHERAEREEYQNRVASGARKLPSAPAPYPSPADPSGLYAKTRPFRDQIMVSVSGLGKRRGRRGPMAYADVPERTPYPKGTFTAQSGFLLQPPAAPMPAAPGGLTAEQRARVGGLTAIQVSEEHRVPTGGAAEAAFLRCAEEQGAEKAISLYPFARKGGTGMMRRRVSGEEDFTQEEADMFLRYMPTSPQMQEKPREKPKKVRPMKLKPREPRMPEFDPDLFDL